MSTEYKKYSICNSEAEAWRNVDIISANMRQAGILSDNERWATPLPVGEAQGINCFRFFYENPETEYLKNTTPAFMQMDDNPAYVQMKRYKIYDYLTESARMVYSAHTIAPHSIDYIKDVLPRFHKVITLQKGFSVLTKFYEDITLQNEILKVSEAYDLNPHNTAASQYPAQSGEVYPAGMDVYKRTKTREWQDDQGNYNAGDEKTTEKYYTAIEEVMAEGERRRTNIRRVTEKDFVMIRIVMGNSMQGQTQQDAEEEGLALRQEFIYEYGEYIAGNVALFLDAIYNNSTFNYMDVVVPNGLQVPPQIPSADLLNESLQKSWGLSMRMFLINSYGGFI